MLEHSYTAGIDRCESLSVFRVRLEQRVEPSGGLSMPLGLQGVAVEYKVIWIGFHRADNLRGNLVKLL